MTTLTWVGSPAGGPTGASPRVRFRGLPDVSVNSLSPKGRRRVPAVAWSPCYPRGAEAPATELPGSRAPASRLAALSSSPIAPLSAPSPPCHPGAEGPLADPAPYCRGLYQLAWRSGRGVTLSDCPARPAGDRSPGGGSPVGGRGLTRPSATTSLASRTRRFGPSGIR